MRLKFELYEEAGVREYWVVNPVEENLVVFLLETETNRQGERGPGEVVGRFGGAKMYAGSDLLKSRAVPGFNIQVDEIFEK